jgi:hypothetical protein
MNRLTDRSEPILANVVQRIDVRFLGYDKYVTKSDGTFPSGSALIKNLTSEKVSSCV